MKKIVLLIITILCLCGCEKEEDKTMIITLKGNPTTGFEWVCNVEDESIIKLVSNEYIPNKVEEGIAGAGGVYKITLEGLKEGISGLNCEYERSWEEEPIYGSNYNIKVDENKDLTIINRSGSYKDEIDINKVEPILSSNDND